MHQTNMLMKTMTTTILGLLSCLCIATAAESEKGPYAQLDAKILKAVEGAAMPNVQKAEIIDFWDAFMQCHKATKTADLPMQDIPVDNKFFPLELKDQRLFAKVGDLAVPLIIKDNHYFLTTGEIVSKAGAADELVLELHCLVGGSGRFGTRPMTMAEVLEAIKP